MNKLTVEIKNSIIEQIENMVSDIPGFTPVDQLYTLFNLVFTTSNLEGDIVEIGSWCGRSSAVLALAAQVTGNTSLYCFDLFPQKNDWWKNDDNTYSFQVKVGNVELGAYQDQKVWEKPFMDEIMPIYEKYESIYEFFQNNISRLGLSNIVNATKGNSDMLNEKVPQDFKCRLAFIDGDHSYDSVCKDIDNIYPHLIKGGWICFDDAFSHYDGVNEAIVEMVIKNDNYDLCQQMTRKLFIARKISS